MKLGNCIFRRIFFLLSFVIFISFASNVAFASNENKSNIEDAYDFNRLIIMLEKGHLYEENYKLLFSEEVNAIQDLTEELDRANEHYQQILQIDLKVNSNVNDYINRIKNSDCIYHISFNERYCLSSTNINSYINPNQWGLEKINIEGAWEYTTGTKEVRVAIIDSGVSKHIDLVDNISDGVAFYYDNDNPYEDRISHGTCVAGIIGAKGNNKTGMTGVCKNVTLIPLKVNTNTGIVDMGSVIKAISHVIASYNTDKPISIINFSIVSAKEKPELESLIRQFSGLFICAAGNDNLETGDLNIDVDYLYPAFYGSSLYENPLENLIVVGNSDKDDTKAFQSGYGKKSVNLFAPGQNIYSTIPGDKYGYDSGTSFATPFVTGVAALLLSKYPNMTPSEVKASILMNVDKISSLSEYCTTGGRLNAYKALSNPHFHSFRYIPKTVSHHQKYCDCGLFSFPLEEHLYLGGNCAVCNAPHTHSYSTQYYNKLGHIEKCICGQTIGSPSPHVITYEDAHDGDNKAICLGCNAELDLRYDGAQINPFSLINRQETKNGSYILSDGIIVLVEEDIEAYFNGTLVFSNHLSI